MGREREMKNEMKREREDLQKESGPVVDWPAGTPGKIWVGRTAEAVNIWAAKAASTLNKLTNLREACS